MRKEKVKKRPASDDEAEEVAEEEEDEDNEEDDDDEEVNVFRVLFNQSMYFLTIFFRTKMMKRFGFSLEKQSVEMNFF